MICDVTLEKLVELKKEFLKISRKKLQSYHTL